MRAAQLIDLIAKLDRLHKAVGLEVDYDGTRWKWRLKISNVTAEEFSPQHQTTASITGPDDPTKTVVRASG